MRAEKRSIMVLLAACFVFSSAFLGTEKIAAAQIKSTAQAEQKALKKVKNAVVTEVDSDYEKGILVYEVDLVKGDKEYSLKYRASDAKMLEYGWETQYVDPESQNALISKDQCRQMAGRKVKGGKILSCVQKRDDGVDVYKLKLKAGKKRYTLEYHARTGELLEYEWERTVSSSGSKTKKGYIGVEKAKKIALAKVPGASVKKAEFEMDDGVPVYEVELISGNYEYEFKIHAKTGKILEQERDWND